MRRVRGFTVDLDVAPNNVVAWALVYVPEGIPAANLTVNVSAGGIPGSFYTPEQHVICQGIAMNSNGSRTSSRFGRTLASNDQVYLLVKNLGGGDASVCAIIRFAVAFL
jgi:hypothetical protein